MDQTNFYSLFYLDETNNRNTNLKGAADPIDVYPSCASLCSKAFCAAGATFRLVTNNESYLQKRLEILHLRDVGVVGHVFSLSLPRGTPFYSAHYKLDIFQAFGRREFGDEIGLVDLDTVLLKKLPASGRLAVYDISEQIFPVYTRCRIIADIERITGRHLPDARWYGGEFVMGSAASFQKLSHYIDMYWPNYLKHMSQLGHIGDEMILSTALNVARADGVQLIDYGKVGLVARWWTARTQHNQIPFEGVKNVALLHLPADKVFLAKQAGYQFDRDAFLSNFRRYAKKKIISRRLVGLGDRLLGRPKRFTPKMSFG